eukprot:jgi/Tetstr1/426425/TSEL_016733.t1
MSVFEREFLPEGPEDAAGQGRGWRRRVHSSGGRQMEANLPGTAVAAGRAEEADGGESRRSRRSPPVQFSGGTFAWQRDTLSRRAGGCLAAPASQPGAPARQLEAASSEPGGALLAGPSSRLGCWRARRGGLPASMEMLLMGYAAVEPWTCNGEAEWRRWRGRGGGDDGARGGAERGPAAGAATPIAMARWTSRTFVQAHGPEGAARRLPANLRDWIRLQRYLRCLALLPAERAALFAQVDIDLAEPGSSSWEANFKDLLAFRQEYGHCEVPSRWERNPFLPVWLRLQLQRMREGELPEEYIEQLVEAGVLDSS